MWLLGQYIERFHKTILYISQLSEVQHATTTTIAFNCQWRVYDRSHQHLRMRLQHDPLPPVLLLSVRLDHRKVHVILRKWILLSVCEETAVGLWRSRQRRSYSSALHSELRRPDNVTTKSSKACHDCRLPDALLRPQDRLFKDTCATLRSQARQHGSTIAACANWADGAHYAICCQGR